MINIYICLDCGELFTEPYKQKVKNEYWGIISYTTHIGCPNCGGAYKSAIKCDVCNEYINGKYIETDNGDIICDECYTVKDATDG